jgi:hypothetical protein
MKAAAGNAPEPEQPPEPPAPPPLPDGASVQVVGEPGPAGVWHLVTYGAWQISVAPDGLLMFPRHLHPREWADFVAAGSIAANVAAQVVADNEAKGALDDRSLPSGRAIITEGPPPAGAMRMITTPGPNQPSPQARKATIGRPRRNGRKIAPPGAMV